MLFRSLKKRGTNYIACCPFHNEKSPSFNVNQVRGIYKCFGCGKSGDSVSFVMEIEGLSFPEAIKFLAKKYGIEIQESTPTNEDLAAQNERESLYIALNFAKEHYKNLLFNHEDGQAIGLSYFKERGFNHKTISNFELGYSLDVWDDLTKTAVKAGYSVDILEKAGLSIRKESDGRAEAKVFDRFRARVTFPIHNLSGKVIAFGARILSKEKSVNQPKYLNSPETEVYHKSNVLYGIYQAKQAIRQEDVCFLVEGYTDVISLHQAGISNVVASSGTSLTVEQIQLIARFSKNITVLYDGDAAGIKASLRGTDMILEAGLNVKVVVFPTGEDPDSYVQQVGSEAFKTYIKETAKDFITFKAELSIKEAGDDPFKRAEMIKDIVDSISKIPDNIKRTVFFQKTAAMMKIDEAILVAEANKIYLNRKNTEANRRPRNEQTTPQNNLPQAPRTSLADGEFMTFEEGDDVSFESFTPPNQGGQTQTPPEFIAPSIVRTSISYHEEECIRLLVCFGMNEIEKDITLTDYVLHELRGLDFLTPLYHRFLSICREAHQKQSPMNTQDYLALNDEEIRQETINLVTEKHQLSHNWKEMHQIIIPTDEHKLSELAFTNILRLKKVYNEIQMKEVKQKLSDTNDSAEQDQLLMLWMQLKNREKLIANELGIVIGR